MTRMLESDVYHKVDHYFKKRFLASFKHDMESGKYSDLSTNDLCALIEDYKVMGYIITELRTVFAGLKFSEEYVTKCLNRFNECCIKHNITDLKLLSIRGDSDALVYVRIEYLLTDDSWCGIEDIIDYLVSEKVYV